MADLIFVSYLVLWACRLGILGYGIIAWIYDDGGFGDHYEVVSMTDKDDDLAYRYRPTPGFVDMLRQRWIESGGAGKGNSEPARMDSPEIGDDGGAVLRIVLDNHTMRLLDMASEDRGVSVEELAARAVDLWITNAKSVR